MYEIRTVERWGCLGLCRLLPFFMVLFLVACEKPLSIDDEEPPVAKGKGNVVLTVAGYEQFSNAVRSTVSLTEVCSRLHFVFYQDGDRKKTVTQKRGDDNFGTLEVSLDAGDYEVLILGHSCTGKENPTMTHPEKIMFSNLNDAGNGTGYSDTFYFFEGLTVNEEMLSRTYTLQRATAMLRFVTTDTKPAEVKRMRFYYTGGSGALDCYMGVGCVKSTQVAFLDTPASSDNRPVEFDVFTFPRSKEGAMLTLRVTAYNASDEVLFDRSFSDISVQRNVISHLSGEFFVDVADVPDDPGKQDTPDTPGGTDTPDTPGGTDTPDTPASTSLLVNAEWADTWYFTF